MEHPEILIEVLTLKPQIIYEALAKITPWQNLATKDDVRRLEERMVTKEDLKQYATKEDLERVVKKFENMITALGAGWGVFSEDAFRQGLQEILKDAGWVVSREINYDKDGYVFDEPSEVEINIVVRDGKVIMIEMTAALKRGDLRIIKRKRELYERIKGIRVNAVYAVTPFIHDKYPERAIGMARDMDIEIVYPTP